MIAAFRRAALGVAVTTAGTFTIQAATLAEWTFESPLPADAPNVSVYPNNVGPSTGAGNAGGFHASAATDWTTPAGNGSTDSFSSNEWAIGDYYQFQLSTVGFDTIQVSWDQTRSGTGPGTFDLAYSVDGTNFSIFADNYVVNAVTWSSGTAVTGSSFAFDLSGIAAINNQSTLLFRLVADAAPSAAGGTSRVDNFKIIGSVPVPPAVDRYWDANGGPGVGGSGTWNASNTNWKSAADGTGSAVSILPSDRANFGGSSQFTPFTVSVDAAGVTANGGLVFETEGYTISGPGTLTLGAGAVAVNHATGTTTISSVIQGTSGITKSGVGSLALAAANTFSGNVSINGGAIVFDQDNRFGNPSNSIVLDSGTLAPSATVTLAATRNLSGTGSIVIQTGQTFTVGGNVSLGNIVLAGTDASHTTAGELNLSGATNSIGAITFNDPVGITAPNGVTLTGNITMPDVASTVRITGAVALAGTGGVRKITVTDTPQDIDFLFDGGVTGSSRLHKVGDGTLKLQGNNSETFTGGIRFGTAGSGTEPGGRLIIDDKNDLGTGGSLQIQYNDGQLHSLTNLTGANALPVGVSLGAGQLGPGIFSGSPIEFTGTFQLFKPGGFAFQHRIQVDTNVTFTGAFDKGGATDTTSVGLLVTGTGSATFNGATNSTVDAIEIDGPTVSINGTFSEPSANVSVKSGRFSGNAILAGGLAAGDTIGVDDAIISPGGAGIGSMSAASLVLDKDAVLELQINSGLVTPATDSLSISGIVIFGGDGADKPKLVVTDLGNTAFSAPLALTIIDNAPGNTITGEFEGLSGGTMLPVGSNQFQIQYNFGPDGNDVALVLVPEPTAISGMLLGASLLGLRSRRRAAS